MGYEQQIVNKALSWVGKQMTWIAFDPRQSSLCTGLDKGTLPGTINPTKLWRVNCFEMPLMAAIASNGITQWYVKKVVKNPNYYLKGYELRECNSNTSPRLGDLVFWKSLVDDTSILSRVFGKDESTSVDWGLDHVALATGKGDEVVSFWEDNVIKKTTIRAINDDLKERANGMKFKVSSARGPWYWKYWIW